MALTKVTSGLISADASSVDLNIDAGTLYIDATNNRVGIGTTSPSELLEVSSATGATSINPSVVRISTTTSSGTWDNNSTWGALQFYNADVSDGGAKTHVQIAANTASTTGGISDLTFSLAAATTGTLTERMRIDSSGNVGIGTNSPNADLHISSALPDIRLTDSDDSSEARISYNTAGSNGLIISADEGNTVASSVMRFHVDGSEAMRITSGGGVIVGGSATSGTFSVYGSGGIELAFNSTASSASIQSYSSSPLLLNPLGNNVGIGTSSPASTLDVAGNIVTTNGAGTTYNQFANSGNDVIWENRQNGNIIIRSNSSTERMRIDSSGNVGINTSSTIANAILNVDGGINTTTGIIGTLTSDSFTFNGQTNPHYGINFNPTGSRPIGISGYAGIAFATSGLERMRIDGSGNLLVGLTSITDTTSRTYGNAFSGSGTYANWTSWGAGTGHQHAVFRNSTNAVGSITTGASSTAYNTSSDARLKEVTGSARGLEVINALNPVSYNWKVDGKSDEGLIAQEVLEIVPNAVSGSEEEYYQMDYSKLVTHLVAGMKEQQTLIEQLQAEVALLKGE